MPPFNFILTILINIKNFIIVNKKDQRSIYSASYFGLEGILKHTENVEINKGKNFGNFCNSDLLKTKLYFLLNLMIYFIDSLKVQLRKTLAKPEGKVSYFDLNNLLYQTKTDSDLDLTIKAITR